MIDDATLSIEAIAVCEHNIGLYKPQADFNHGGPEINSVQLQSPANFWHKRLGHFHTKGMQRMLAAEAVKGMPPLRFSATICNGCQLGKHAHTKLPK